MITVHVEIDTTRSNVISAYEMREYNDLDVSRLTLVYTKGGGVTVEVETENDVVLGAIEEVFLDLSLEVEEDAESKEGNPTD